MPDTRRKLIELLRSEPEILAAAGVSATATLRLADHLIACGVTVGKPLTEFLHPVDAYPGLKEKYLVFKADTGEEVAGCFILRPAKDPAAVEALRAYAGATDNETLAEDIYNWVGKGAAVQEQEEQHRIPVTERLPDLVPCGADYWWTPVLLPLPEPPKEDTV